MSSLAVTIDELQIEIQSTSSGAAEGIERLSKALGGLKRALNVAGLTKLKDGLSAVVDAVKPLPAMAGAKLSSLAKGMADLASAPKITAATIRNIKKLAEAGQELADIDFAALARVSSALAGVGAASGAGAFTPSVNAVKKSQAQVSGLPAIIPSMSNAIIPAAAALDVFKGAAFQANEGVRMLGDGTVELSSDMYRVYDDAEEAASGFRIVKEEVTKASGGMSTFSAWLKRVVGGLKRTKSATSEAASAAKKGSKGFGQFFTSLKRIAMYRMVRFVLAQISRAVSEGIKNLALYSKAIGGIDASRANETMSRFATMGMQVKNSIGAALMPTLKALMPVIQTLASWFIIAANAVNQFFAAITGASTWTKAKEYAVDYADGIDKASGSVKKLKGLLAGFDEINIIQSDSGGSGGAGGADFGEMFEESSISDKMSKIAEWTNNALAKIREFLSTALGVLATSLGLLVIGTLLVFSGANIPLGLGLMAAGAVLFGTQIAAQWDTLPREIQDSIAAIMIVVGAGLFVIGAVLAFSGANVALGIGLMLAGAASMGTAASLHWDAITEALQGALGGVVAAISGSLLALGAVLAFSGAAVPLGIGLMAVGAAGLATTAAVNWDSILEALRGTVGGITAIASGALLAIGLVLALSGVALPLGIGLIAAGATGLATVTTLNWDTITGALKGPIGGVTAAVSAALLVIGAILAFSGVGLPLGIGLMAAGAVGLATTTTLNWDLVKNKVASVVAGIGAILSGSLIVLGVLLCLSGAGLGLGLAVLAAGLAGSYAAWTLDDNPITRFVKKMANSIIGIINTVIDAINEMFHISFNGLKLFGETIIPAFDVRLVNIPKIATFADGGYPVTGQMFLAREAGPELVGTMGGRTTVANNDQIEAGIEEAAYRGFMRALAQSSSNGGETTVVMQVGETELGRVAIRGINKVQRQAGVSLVTG